MDIKMYYNDERIQIKSNNQIIEQSNYLFSNKKFINMGRVIDYDIFIECLELLFNNNKIKRKKITILLGQNNDKIDILLLKETLNKMGFKTVYIIKIQDFIKKVFSEGDFTAVINYKKYSEIYVYKTNKLVNKYTIPQKHLKYVNTYPLYIFGKKSNILNNAYYIENYHKFLICEL